jgi:hypothetical protein
VEKNAAAPTTKNTRSVWFVLIVTIIDDL